MRAFITVIIVFFIHALPVFASADKLGCDEKSQKLDIENLKSQGYEITKTFKTQVLMYQYGDKKYFELMPAYQLENKDGIVKYATCVGLFNSLIRSGIYISNHYYGAYVKINPFMTSLYEMKFDGFRVTGNLSNRRIVPGFAPFNGVLSTNDVKFNVNGSVFQVLFHRTGEREYWGEVQRLVEHQCLNVQLPFSKIILSATSTKPTHEKARLAVTQELVEKFNQKKNECEGAVGGRITVCKESKYPNSVTRKRNFSCNFTDMKSTDEYYATSDKIDFTVPNQVTHSRTSYDILCLSIEPWQLVEVKKCPLAPVDSAQSPAEEPIIIDIKDTQNREDILVPQEVKIPPGGVEMRLINNSSFYIEFKGSIQPSQGSLKPGIYTSRAVDSINIQVMPGNEIRLSPYPNRYHYIRFTGDKTVTSK